VEVVSGDVGKMVDGAFRPYVKVWHAEGADGKITKTYETLEFGDPDLIRLTEVNVNPDAPVDSTYNFQVPRIRQMRVNDSPMVSDDIMAAIKWAFEQRRG